MLSDLHTNLCCAAAPARDLGPRCIAPLMKSALAPLSRHTRPLTLFLPSAPRPPRYFVTSPKQIEKGEDGVSSCFTVAATARHQVLARMSDPALAARLLASSPWVAEEKSVRAPTGRPEL